MPTRAPPPSPLRPWLVSVVLMKGGNCERVGNQRKNQREGGRVPDVRRDAVLLKHFGAPEDLQGVGHRRWVKPLTGAD